VILSAAAAAPFDDEGAPAGKTIWIEKGCVAAATAGVVSRCCCHTGLFGPGRE